MPRFSVALNSCLGKLSHLCIITVCVTFLALVQPLLQLFGFGINAYPFCFLLAKFLFQLLRILPCFILPKNPTPTHGIGTLEIKGELYKNIFKKKNRNFLAANYTLHCTNHRLHFPGKYCMLQTIHCNSTLNLYPPSSSCLFINSSILLSVTSLTFFIIFTSTILAGVEVLENT